MHTYCTVVIGTESFEYNKSPIPNGNRKSWNAEPLAGYSTTIQPSMEIMNLINFTCIGRLPEKYHTHFVGNNIETSTRKK